MNKLDDFFKDRLTDFAPGDKNWNVPSDDLWGKALPHLPKKKKRRYGFLWFFLGMAVAGGLTAAFVYNNQEILAGGQLATTQTVTKNIDQDSKSTKRSDRPAIESIAPIITADQSNTQKRSPQKQVNSSLDKEYSLSNNSTVQNTEKVALTTSIDGKGSIALMTAAKSSAARNFENSMNVIPAETQAGSELQRDGVVAIVKEKSGRTIVKTKLSDPIFISNLPLVDAMLLRQSDALWTTPALELAPVKDITPLALARPNSEIGLSYTHLLLNIVGAIDIDAGPMDEVILTGNYSNINLEYGKFIGNRWSFNSGAYLSRLDMSIDLCIFDQLGSDDLDSFVESNVDNVLPRNDVPSEQRVELLEGVELVEGDILTVKGTVGLDIKVLQIPLLLNYHWNKKRTEFYVGAGASLDMLWLKQSSAEVQVFKEGALITEPIVQQEEQETFFDYTIYAQFGMRYRLSPKFNVGLGAKVSVLDPIFSGVNVGVYYRWHK